jgi:hypothetical protein
MCLWTTNDQNKTIINQPGSQRRPRQYSYAQKTHKKKKVFSQLSGVNRQTRSFVSKWQDDLSDVEYTYLKRGLKQDRKNILACNYRGILQITTGVTGLVCFWLR